MNTKDNIVTCCGALAIGVFILGLMFGPWIVKSHFEAAAFNRATGKNVSTWDAMWVELRVEGEGK
jgi:hypothetical protein